MILGVIPARGGSKGLPGKNIKDLLGKPVISYTIDAAKKSKLLDKIVVSTEDSSMANVCQQLGIDYKDYRPQVENIVICWE